MEKIDLSHSKMDVMRSCRQQYKYKYIDKIKIADADREAADFGSLIHSIAENYTGNGKEELLALYHKFKEKYKISEEYRLKIPLALKNLHTFHKEYILQADEVNREIEIRIDLNENISINGKIDVIVKKDGIWYIGDYKTKKNNKWYNPKDQLATYMLLIHSKYGVKYGQMDPLIIYLCLDESDKYGNTVMNEGISNIIKKEKMRATDVELLIREIEVIYKRLEKYTKTGEWPADPDKFKCKFCDYKELCPSAFHKNESNMFDL